MSSTVLTVRVPPLLNVPIQTFIIAAIMAMRHSRLTIFCAALSSLAIMSMLSAYLGHAVPHFISKRVTNYLATALFLVFGIRMIIESRNMPSDFVQLEIDQVQSELEMHDDQSGLTGMEEGGYSSTEHSPGSILEQYAERFKNLMQLVASPVFVETFVMTFVAEWGDRSQIATVALGAASVR